MRRTLDTFKKQVDDEGPVSMFKQGGASASLFLPEVSITEN